MLEAWGTLKKDLVLGEGEEGAEEVEGGLHER